MAFTQVLYVSQALTPASQAGDEIAKILVSARRYNAAEDITGCLAYFDGCFFQVIEGEREAVERTLARITADARHTDVKVRMRREVAARSFPDWRMTGLLPEARDLSCSNLPGQPAVILLAELMRLAEKSPPPR
jgi:hypothetical protein